MLNSIVRLVTHMACCTMIIFLMTTAVTDATRASSLFIVSAEAEPPFSQLSSSSLASVNFEKQQTELHNQVLNPDAMEEDYGGWDPAPYFGGGSRSPIPHSASGAPIPDSAYAICCRNVGPGLKVQSRAR